MDSQKPHIEELQALQESLELQRRQVLALILEMQDAGAGPEETEKARLKLMIINRELGRCTAQKTALRRKSYMFETPEKIQAITQDLQKFVSPEG